MKFIILGLLMAAATVLAKHSHRHQHSPPHEARGPHTDDQDVETQAAKNPIISHLLIMLTTMYHGIHSYSKIKGPTGEEQPKFCHKYECPKYTVLCSNAFYEVRKYVPSTFIVTSVPADSIHDPGLVGFLRLHAYMMGDNDKNVKLNMTRPVAVQSVYPVNKDNQTNHTSSARKLKDVFVYLPSEYQKDPPTPTNYEVRILESPEQIMYVKMFAGLVLRQLWSPMKARFYDELVAFNQTVDPKYRALAVTYDKPSILLHRHNEIFYHAADIKEDSKYCSPN